MISHLPDAVVSHEDGTRSFAPKKGQKVIIERWATVLPGSPWLDTKVYQVMEVNQESGRLMLLDLEAQNITLSDWKTGTEVYGWRFKEFGPMLPGGSSEEQLQAPAKKKTVVKAHVAPATSKSPSTKGEGVQKLQRIYSTRGLLHTRVKGIAYCPQGNTSAFAVGDRVVATLDPEGSLLMGPDEVKERWFLNEVL